MTTIDPIVYRFYEDDHLLYIGKTISPRERLKKHRREKDWFKQVTTIKLDRYDTEAEALDAERQAIVAEAPAHNIQHNTMVGKAEAMNPDPPTTVEGSDPLVGMFYLEWEQCAACGSRGRVLTQGQVVARNDYGYLVTEFSWLTGDSLHTVFASDGFPHNATFYFDQEWFIHTAEAASVRPPKQCHCEAQQ